MSFRHVFVAGFLMGISSCAPSIKQYYPGNFDPEKRIYQNKSLGFSLTFRGSWIITANPKEMSKTSRGYSKELHKSGAELLYSGSTVENTQGTRCIVVNLNEPSDEYAEQIRQINKAEIDSDSGCTLDTIRGVPLVVWKYAKNEFDFIEYFFTIDTYDIRMAFWTKPKLFYNFLPIYEEIMSTLSIETR